MALGTLIGWLGGFLKSRLRPRDSAVSALAVCVISGGAVAEWPTECQRPAEQHAEVSGDLDRGVFAVAVTNCGPAREYRAGSGP